MQKRYVHVVTGRHRAGDSLVGPVVTAVVCAENEKKVRGFLARAHPNFSITTITSLVTLEERAKKVKSALAGQVPDWLVVVDPDLLPPRAALAATG